MKVETKYELGDSVFFMDNNRVQSMEVFAVKIEHTLEGENVRVRDWAGGTHIVYALGLPNTSTPKVLYYRREEELFSSKQTLLATL